MCSGLQTAQDGLYGGLLCWITEIPGKVVKCVLGQSERYGEVIDRRAGIVYIRGMKVIELSPDEKPGRYTRSIVGTDHFTGGDDPVLAGMIEEAEKGGYTEFLWKNRENGAIIYLRGGE